MTKAKRKKNKILKTITAIEVMILFMGVSGFDSGNPTIPIIMALQAGLWLLLFLAANPNYESND